MKEKAKFIIGSFFKSLVNNDAAIEGGKKGPWWMALTMFILSIALPVIPVVVNSANTNAEQAFGNGAFNLDKYLTQVSLSAKESGVEFKVQDGNCFYVKDGTVVTENDAQTPLLTYTSEREEFVTNDAGETISTGNKLTQYEFNVYYSQSVGASSLKALRSDLAEKKYVVGTTTPKATTDADETLYYTPSFLVITKDSLYLTQYQTSTTTVITKLEYSADWKNTKDCNLIERVLNVKDIINNKVTNQEYVDGVYKNWKKVFNETYVTVRNKTTLSSFLIYLGVYAALIIVMGFMIWLLTRGRNNPFNYLSYWATTKISCWASFCPALLGLIGGFILPRYAAFAFIIFLGIRIMWLSMKNLRPVY